MDLITCPGRVFRVRPSFVFRTLCLLLPSCRFLYPRRWYKHDLERIKAKFGDKCQEINSEASIRKWNSGDIQIGLIHPMSAGHGLNLQEGGSNLVWYGLTWSLELYQQTIARLYRQGQKSETVVIQHIITKGTIDESILSALRNKDKTQSALIDAVKANI